MLLYWKYREGNKLLSLSPSTSWYLTCEPDNRGNYMLILFANGVKMMIDDGYMYSLHGPDMDDRDLRSFFNSIIDEVAGVASSSPRIIDLEEIKHNLITTRYPDFSMFDGYDDRGDADDDDDDDDEEYGNDYDFNEEYY